ncbi:predicted protein [Botrytis cinerea T4]|uniref:Uncharacterized protein n=1 Tax=Botryotinia fuckeliana (strain T4) TaxID=999810 RepID=G2XUE3_BOTF4|nr:predicted protein [Botrytis cinerea T4]
MNTTWLIGVLKIGDAPEGQGSMLAFDIEELQGDLMFCS